MMKFEVQQLFYEKTGSRILLAVLVFDAAHQKMTYAFYSAPALPERERAIARYVEREISQMAARFDSPLQFTAFRSLEEITGQLLPDENGTIRFSSLHHVEGLSADEALANAVHLRM